MYAAQGGRARHIPPSTGSASTLLCAKQPRHPTRHTVLCPSPEIHPSPAPPEVLSKSKGRSSQARWSWPVGAPGTPPLFSSFRFHGFLGQAESRVWEPQALLAFNSASGCPASSAMRYALGVEGGREEVSPTPRVREPCVGGCHVQSPCSALWRAPMPCGLPGEPGQGTAGS